MIDAQEGRQTGIFGLVIFLAMTFLGPGCNTPLDRQQLELVKNWGQANNAFIVAIKTYQKQNNSIVKNYIQYERDAQQQTFNRFLAANSVDGVLVETDQDDRIVLDDQKNPKPMKLDAMQTEITFYMNQVSAVDDKLTQWKQVDAELTKAILIFEAMNQSGMETSEEIAQAKASAQALLEYSLSALAGLGLGAMIP